MFKRILSWTLDNSNKQSILKPLLKGASTVLLIQVLGRGIGYFDQILLARWMGVEEYGLYVYVIIWATLATTPVQLGLRSSLVRFIPEYRAKGEMGRLRGVVYSSLGLVITASTVLSFLASAIVYLINTQSVIANFEVILLGIWLMPLVATIQINMSIMQGFRNMSAAFAPMILTRPILILIGASFLYFIGSPQQTLSSLNILWVSFFALCFILVSQFWIVHSMLSSVVRGTEPVYDLKGLLRVSFPLLLAACFNNLLVQSDIVMLGVIRGPEEVGLYNVAVRTAGLIGFLLTGVTASSAPIISKAYAEDNTEKLQKIMLRSGQAIVVPSLIILLGVVLFSKPLLENFGPEFVAVQGVLIILAFSMFIKSTSGPVTQLLDMTGYQDDSAKIRGFTATLNLILNILGIYTLGFLGAALATFTSLIVNRALTDYVAAKRLHMQTSLLFLLTSKILPRRR
ncbi:MAG: oligosaccharide flippase family protein [Cyanobacteria bacterium]|jgi:O-antigen/teichoic acid export membrane protein|nr:oligosaccharide flippase family protein [Cyanobacteria bacterium GSL.Bin1]